MGLTPEHFTYYSGQVVHTYHDVCDYMSTVEYNLVLTKNGDILWLGNFTGQFYSCFQTAAADWLVITSLITCMLTESTD